jgi:hypothetical protein
MMTVTFVPVTSPEGGVRITICGAPDMFGVIETTSNAEDRLAVAGD